MEVPIARMPVGCYDQTVSLSDLLDPNQELWYSGDRNRDVIQDKARTDPGQGGVSGLAGIPELQPLLLVLGRLDQTGIILLQDTEYHIHLGLYLFAGVAVRLRQDHDLRVGEIDVCILLDGFEGNLVQNLHDAGGNPTAHGLGDGLTRILQPTVGSNRGHGVAGDWVNFQRHLGDHPQSSFRSDE